MAPDHQGRPVRRLAAVAAVAALVAAVAMAVRPPALAQTPVIQPGSPLRFGDNYCTANWVYDGPKGAVYVGSAAHCTMGVGQEVELAAGTGGPAVQAIGRVVHTGAGSDLDYALVGIYPSVVPQVRAEMAGHPGIPKGVSTAQTAKRGDIVQFSGHGAGFHLTPATQRQRIGVFNFFRDRHQFSVGPVTPGDSGGPVANVTDGNKALGVISTLGVNVAFPDANVGAGGVALDALLADAAAQGFPVRLRTV